MNQQNQSSHTPPPEFEAIASRFETLKDEIGLTQLANAISEIAKDVVELPESVGAVRTRGYVFAAYLEAKIKVITERWDVIDEQVQRSVPQEAFRLRQPFAEAERAFQYAQSAPADTDRVARTERELSQAEQLKNEAVTRIKALYEPVEREISSTIGHLEEITWVLDQRDEASFKFLAGENVFLAAKAEYDDPGREDPDGILYLTDQRIVFEQKETTGKKLGLFGGKKTQEIEWEVPLNLVEKVEAENKGLFGGKDMLTFTFKPGASVLRAVVEVKGGVQSKFWATQITRMIEGKTNDERAIQPDAATLASLASAPTECPVCKATLPMLVANQRQLACDYCGAVIRV